MHTCVHVCIYVVSSFFLKIPSYRDILNKKRTDSVPFHARSPQAARWTSILRQAYIERCFRVAIDNTRFTSPSRVDSTTKYERRCHDATSVARTTPGQWGYLPPTALRSHSRGCSNPVAVRPVRFTAHTSVVDSSARFHLPHPRLIGARWKAGKIEMQFFFSYKV